LFLWQKFFIPPVPVSQPNTKVETTNTQTEQTKAAENAVNVDAPTEKRQLTLKNGENEFEITNSFEIRETKTDDSIHTLKNHIGTDIPLQVFLTDGSTSEEIIFDKFELVTNDKIFASSSKQGLSLTGDLKENGQFVFQLKSTKEAKLKFVLKSEAKELDNS